MPLVGIASAPAGRPPAARPDPHHLPHAAPSPDMKELLAALGLAVCTALLVHMLLPPSARGKVEQGWRGLVAALRGSWRSAARRAPGKPARKPARPGEQMTQRDAERLAQDAIDRARRVDWQGNVAHPDAFRRPPAREQEPKP